MNIITKKEIKDSFQKCFMCRKEVVDIFANNKSIYGIYKKSRPKESDTSYFQIHGLSPGTPLRVLVCIAICEDCFEKASDIKLQDGDMLFDYANKTYHDKKDGQDISKKILDIAKRINIDQKINY